MYRRIKEVSRRLKENITELNLIVERFATSDPAHLGDSYDDVVEAIKIAKGLKSKMEDGGALGFKLKPNTRGHHDDGYAPRPGFDVIYRNNIIGFVTDYTKYYSLYSSRDKWYPHKLTKLRNLQLSCGSYKTKYAAAEWLVKEWKRQNEPK